MKIKLGCLLILLLISTVSFAVDSVNDIDTASYYSNRDNHPSVLDSEAGSYFIEFQFALKNDLKLTGQWTHLYDPYNDGYAASKMLRPVEWSLANESRTSSAGELGINWTVFESLHAYAKVQTVNGSPWIPLVSVPRFVTQESEQWTLAAVSLVYRF